MAFGPKKAGKGWSQAGKPTFLPQPKEKPMKHDKKKKGKGGGC